MYKIQPLDMPSIIIDSKVKADTDETMRRAVRIVQDSFAQLTEVSGFRLPRTADLEAWDAAVGKAHAKLEQMKEAISGDITLDETEKEKKVKAWSNWHRKIMLCTTSLTRALREWPQLGWCYDGDLDTITPTASISQLAEQSATRPVPPEATEHARLIREAGEAIARLREWERAHDVRKLRLEILLDFTEEQLSERWAVGSIAYDTAFVTPQVIAARQFGEQSFI